MGRMGRGHDFPDSRCVKLPRCGRTTHRTKSRWQDSRVFTAEYIEDRRGGLGLAGDGMALNTAFKSKQATRTRREFLGHTLYAGAGLWVLSGAATAASHHGGRNVSVAATGVSMPL